MARRLIIVLAAGVVALTACNPVKPSAPVPGRSIAYYYVDDVTAGDVFRSKLPFNQSVNGGMGTARQTLAGNGQVGLEVINSGCPCGATSGFYTPFIPLGSLNELTVRIVPGGNDVLVSLVFDVDGDGDWGQWDANGMQISLGNDETGIGPFTAGGQVIIDDNRSFSLVVDGGTYTLGELKAGAVAGIDSNTPVGILVETVPSPFNPDGDATSIVSQILVNGIQALP